MLQGLVNQRVVIRLKWGQMEYRGLLVSVDSYMNVQLSNTEEVVDGQSKGTLGQVLIRYVAILLCPDVLLGWKCQNEREGEQARGCFALATASAGEIRTDRLITDATTFCGYQRRREKMGQMAIPT